MINPQEVINFSERELHPRLAGQPAEFQGAVLADLLAIWLAGHFVSGDVNLTRELRADLLVHHLEAVRDLISINAARMGLPHDPITAREPAELLP